MPKILKVLALVLTAVIALMLFGCQSGSDGEANTPHAVTSAIDATWGESAKASIAVEYVNATSAGPDVAAVLSLTQGWQPLERVNLGLRKDGYWFRVLIHNPMGSLDKMVVVSDWRADIIEGYQIKLQDDVARPVMLFSSGSTKTFTSKPTQERDIAFSVQLDSDRKAELLIYVKSSFAVQMPVAVHDQDEYRRIQDANMLTEAMLVGFMLALVLTNLLNFFASKEWVWFSGATLILVWMFVAAHISGAGYQFLWPNSPEMNSYVRILSPALVLASGVQLFFFLLKTYINIDLGRVFPILMWTSIALTTACCTLVLWDPSLTPIVLATKVVPVLCGFTLIGVATYGALRQNQYKVFLLIASVLPGLIGFSVITLNQAGVADFFPGLDLIPMWGTFVNGLFITMIGVVRYQMARSGQTKALAQAALASEDAEANFKLQLAAQHSSQLKTDFLALMSHELRTPMAGIIGMLKLAQRRGDLLEIRERISQAQNNAESMLNILNDLLDLSKIEAGKLTLELIDIDFRKELSDALVLLQERAFGKSIGFETRVSPDIAPYFAADSTRIRQIVLNLLGNAIKFTDRGGVRFEVALLETRADVQWVELSVHDTGIGISPEAISRLFQKFEQADSTTTRRFGGTGLGLSITKQLVELMGGEVSASSELGKGSAFRVKLPLKLGNKPADDDAYVPCESAYSLRVLVAEDVVTNQMVIEGLLEELGHQVHIVEDGRAALCALAAGDFDVVLMDGRMPVMDGLQATRHYRTGAFEHLVFKTTDTPIIALTANASDQDRDRFLAAGVDRFLTKPIDELKLEQALAEVIQKHLLAGRVLTPREPAVDAIAQDAASGLDALDALMLAAPDTGNVAPTLAQPVAAAAPTVKPALRQKMREAFQKQTPDQLQRATEALAQGDGNALAIIVHGIKGGGAYIWPNSEIVSQSARLEIMADGGQLAEVAALWPDYLSLVNRFMAQDNSAASL